MRREPVIDLPHSDEAERAILGSILLSNELLDAVLENLRSDEFYREATRVVFEAMKHLRTAGAAIDLITLGEELHRTGQLERVGGRARLGRLLDGAFKSANISHYVQVVRQKARRREIIRASERLQTAATNGVDEEGLEVLLAELRVVEHESAPLWTPSTLAGVANPEAGNVSYVVDGILPAGETTVIGAAWKSGKTLVAYSLALDIMTGQPAFGSLPVIQPLPVAMFQLEMPPWEDERRLRRLAIGRGIKPDDIPRYAAEGHLVFFNRPPVCLSTPDGAARFQRAVRGCGARVVIIDSLIAAFAGEDLNDNSKVRAMFSRAFGPLTSDGISVLALHHHRKQQTSGRKSHDDRSALLGAQAFGAAAGRVYKLERLSKEEDPEDDRRSFKLRLSMTGSWTPEDAEDLVLAVTDTQDGGTAITLLTEDEQIRRGGMTASQKAGIALAKLVAATPGIERRRALEQVQKEEGISASTVKAGLWYAQNKGWVEVDHPPGRRNNEAVLVPGPAAEDRP